MSERDRRLALPIGQIRTGDTFNKLGVGNNTGNSWSEMEDCIFIKRERDGVWNFQQMTVILKSLFLYCDCFECSMDRLYCQYHLLVLNSFA